jgi:hypothetical protein
MIKLVHPLVFKGRLPLRHAEKMSLIVADDKDTKEHYAKQDSDSYLWDACGLFCSLPSFVAS